MDLVSKFWNFCHTLRHEGIDYSDYIEELTYLLFLKIAEERGVTIPKGCNWENLIKHNDELLLKKYNSILTELSRQKDILGDIFKHPIAKIRNSNSLKKLLLLIDEERWSSYNEDVLGSMFEGLLEKAANESKKGAGQYFTPRPLIEAIVRVMKPNPFEAPSFTISDVACGTGGFIISSFEWFKSKHSISKLSNIDRKKLFEKTFFGQELVVRPRRMAQMNLYLHGISPNIILGDTIYEPLSKVKHSCILTNPPFGTKGANQIPDRSDFRIKTSNKQLNFIQHVFSSLKNLGRAAIVLPDSVLFDDKASDLWKFIMEYCNVHTILRLPRGTFLPYTNVLANVVFFQKGLETKGIWIYDARINLNAVTKKDRPLSFAQFDDFIKSYGSHPNGTSKRTDQGNEGRFRYFTRQEIKARDYNLDVTWLKDDSIEDFGEAKKLNFQASKALKEIQLVVRELKKFINLLDQK